MRYVAELEIARLTGTPRVRALLDAVEQQPDGLLRRDVLAVLSAYMHQQFKSHGSEANSAERAELLHAMTTATGRGVPPYTPQTHHIRAVKKWTTFALVEIGSGRGPQAESGYSALFERRGNRWMFVCVISSWIS